MIVVDASVVLSALLDAGGSGALARRALQRAESRHAPGLLDVEVLSAIRRLTLAQRLPEGTARTALSDLRDLPIVRYPERSLVGAAFDLRDNLTAYDATYVVLAALLDADLVTADARLGRAPALPCRVQVLSS